LPAIAVLVAMSLFIAGCGASDIDSSPSRSRSPRLKPATGPLKDLEYFAYQIQAQEEDGNIERLAGERYDLLVIDQTRSVKDQEDYDSAKDVARLKASRGSAGGGKTVVCYIDVGEAEDYRTYWQDGWRVGNPEWIAAPDPDGWDGNYPVKFWRSEWMDIQRNRIEEIISDGYDGVYLDWLEVYSFEPVAQAARAEGLDPKNALTDFVRALAEYARSRKPGFIFIAQNAAEMGDYPGYAEVFDAVAQESVWFDWEGDPDTTGSAGDVAVNSEDSQTLIDDLAIWQAQGKPVLDIEYAQEEANAVEGYALGAKNGYRTYVTTTLLDELTSTPPPGLP
jgi:cysteinyl-tRNA synthetase